MFTWHEHESIGGGRGIPVGPRRPLGAVGIILALSLPFAGPGFGQTIDQNLWVTNGTVYGVVRDGATVYVAGTFSRVGPATGGGVPLDISTGTPQPAFPRVVGIVRVVIPDGTGGWFIGGGFSSVGGAPRLNLAHLGSDQSVSAWNPGTDGQVRALALRGSTLYVGGIFGNAGGQARNYIAAIDVTTGAATSWNPNANNSVQALAINGPIIYAGGNFTTIGGQSRNHSAR